MFIVLFLLIQPRKAFINSFNKYSASGSCIPKIVLATMDTSRNTSAWTLHSESLPFTQNSESNNYDIICCRKIKSTSPFISKPRDFQSSHFSTWLSSTSIIIYTQHYIVNNFSISTNFFQQNDFSVSRCGWIMNILIMESLKLKEPLPVSYSVGVWSGCKNQERVRSMNRSSISLLTAHTFLEGKGRKVKTLHWRNTSCVRFSPSS